MIQLATIYENIGGDIDGLVENSPFTLLSERIVEMSDPNFIQKFANKKKVTKKKPKKKKSEAQKPKGGSNDSQKPFKKINGMTEAEIEFLSLNAVLDSAKTMHQIVSKVRRREQVKGLKLHIDSEIFWNKVYQMQKNDSAKGSAKKKKKADSCHSNGHSCHKKRVKVEDDDVETGDSDKENSFVQIIEKLVSESANN